MSDATFIKDHEFVAARLDEFFDLSRIQESLDAIEQIGITGWEKWWQVEFAKWLSEHVDISEWSMEEVFLTDLRKTNTTKDFIAIDIGFRRKGYSTAEMLFLEFKQNENWKLCVNNMVTDAVKVDHAQKRSENGLMIRNFFVVGLYFTEDVTVTEIHDYIVKRAAMERFDVALSHIFTKAIKGTPYSVTMF